MSQLSDGNRKQLYEDIRSAESLAPKIASPSLLFGSKAFTHHQAPKQEVKHRDELNPVTPLTMNYGSKLQGSTHPLETFRSLMNFSHLPVPLGLLWKSGKGPKGTARYLSSPRGLPHNHHEPPPFGSHERHRDAAAVTKRHTPPAGRRRHERQHRPPRVAPT